MNSCLYECSVMHHRLAPKEHHFQHNIFMFYLDLDELDEVARNTFLFSRNRPNFYTFRDSDHLPSGIKLRDSSGMLERTALIPSPRDEGMGRGLGRRETLSSGLRFETAPLHEPHPHLTPAQWLPKPATSQVPSRRRALRALGSPPSEGAEREKMGGGGALKENVLACLARNGIQFDPKGKIMLLTLPRVLGYVFNPVSFYFCFDGAGAPVCAIAEVGNTFREMKLFLLRTVDLDNKETFRKIATKHFYVSPFSSLELSFDFKLRTPGEVLEIHIDDRDGDEKVLLSTLAGQRAALSNARLFWFSFKYPLVTLKIIFLIHWHALLLYMKRIPFYRKAANPARQCDVLNPHPTLTGRLE
jgi:hypothetical protein